MCLVHFLRGWLRPKLATDEFLFGRFFSDDGSVGFFSVCLCVCFAACDMTKEQPAR